jgi:hypothetical protein
MNLSEVRALEALTSRESAPQKTRLQRLVMLSHARDRTLLLFNTLPRCPPAQRLRRDDTIVTRHLPSKQTQRVYPRLTQQRTH